MAKPAFTAAEKALIIEKHGTMPLKELVKLFPGRNKRQVSGHVSTHRRSLKNKPVIKPIVAESYQDYNIPLLGKGIITEDIYAFRNGYLLTTESRTSGSGVLESQSVRLKAA